MPSPGSRRLALRLAAVAVVAAGVGAAGAGIAAAATSSGTPSPSASASASSPASPGSPAGTHHGTGQGGSARHCPGAGSRPSGSGPGWHSAG